MNVFERQTTIGDQSNFRDPAASLNGCVDRNGLAGSIVCDDIKTLLCRFCLVSLKRASSSA